MAYYPVMLDLADALVLVVGGGAVAARKAASLLRAGARVRLVAPMVTAETSALLTDERLEARMREFESGDLEGVSLAIAATGDEETNRQVATRARERSIWVNVVDAPDLCSFVVPASLERGELILSVSTSGASPMAARRVRQRLEKEFGPEWGTFLELMRQVREKVIARGRPAQENRPLFQALVDSELLGMIAQGDARGADEILTSVLGPGHTLAGLGLDLAKAQKGKDW